MSNKNHTRPPEPERLIRCKAADTFGEYEVFGMFVPYKPGSGKKEGQSRFQMRMADGTFQSDQATWKEVESWEYADAPK